MIRSERRQPQEMHCDCKRPETQGPMQRVLDSPFFRAIGAKGSGA